MSTVAPSFRLTDEGALQALQACVERAREIGAPVTISICDPSGVLLAALRMDGAHYLSVDTSINKARTAASTGQLTGEREDIVSLKLGLATFGRQTVGLKGGVPIIVEGHCIGGIGAGSASGEQDREISLAGLAAIEGAQTEF
jgi:uncharacterized protein GlcG (DUF336 family)